MITILYFVQVVIGGTDTGVSKYLRFKIRQGISHDLSLREGWKRGCSKRADE